MGIVFLHSCVAAATTYPTRSLRRHKAGAGLPTLLPKALWSHVHRLNSYTIPRLMPSVHQCCMGTTHVGILAFRSEGSDASWQWVETHTQMLKPLHTIKSYLFLLKIPPALRFVQQLGRPKELQEFPGPSTATLRLGSLTESNGDSVNAQG